MATTSNKVGSPVRYAEIRKILMNDPVVRDKLPRFVHTCSQLDHFWPHIQQQGGYHERRAYLEEHFRPLIMFLEKGGAGSPSEEELSSKLTKLDLPMVRKAWQKALERRLSDPEGAITAARSMLESVCKHILDKEGKPYDNQADLPDLYKTVADCLLISPSKEIEKVINQILTGGVSVVYGIATLRNKLGDAHGKGSAHIGPDSKHAGLAINMAGSIAQYLVEVWEEKHKK